MKFLSVGSLLLLLPSAAWPASYATLKDPNRWPQDYVGRVADPDVRFGILPNGLRYAIMHNDSPRGSLAMRMRVGAGSLDEQDDEQGLAHFIEHMAFRGSAHVADGEAARILERQGLEFGADTNAMTTQDETVYMFNFPKSGATALDTGLTLFREIGERLKLAPSAIDSEKGVVLSEERLRDSPPYQAAKASLGTMLDGTKLVSRWPLGDAASIKAADHERLSRFYKRNYRPDDTTLVIVGDIDPATVEQNIRADFSDWKSSGIAPPRELGSPSGRKHVGEFIAPGAPDELILAWVTADDKRADDEVVAREHLLDSIAIAVLNQRLADRALKPASSYLAAFAASSPSLLHSAGITQIGISAAPGKWRQALDAVIDEERSLLVDGVQPDELKRAVTTFRTELETRAAGSSNRKSPSIADAIVNSVNQDSLYSSNAQLLSLATPILDRLTPGEVNGRLKSLFATTPILFRSAERAAAGETGLASALDAAYSRPVAARMAEAPITWPYTSFGQPSRIVGRSADAKLGTTTITFANGTRLTVRPMAREKDKVHISVSLGSGRSGVRRQLAPKLWETMFFPIGGTGKLSIGEINRWKQTQGKMVIVGLSAETRAFVLTGATRPADLDLQMQMLAAYARDPGFRPEATEKAKGFAAMFMGQLETSASAVYVRAAQALTVGNDPRFENLPGAQALAKIGADDLGRLLKEQLAGPADVVMVGNLTLDQAIQATQATFGAGSPRGSGRARTPRVQMPSSAAPLVFEHRGRADQAYFGMIYPLPDYFTDPKSAAAAQVASSIVSNRLIDTVREKLGLTYSPMVLSESSAEIAGEGYFSAAIETPERNFDTFRSLLAEQLKDLASKPVSADELTRAKQPLVDEEAKRHRTSAYWLQKLTEMAREPRIRQQVLTQLGDLSSVSAEDVQTFVGKYLAGRTPLIVISRAAADPTPIATVRK